MKPQEILDPQQWAETTFGQTRLTDMRPTRRAVRAAAGLAEESAASLPAQARTWQETTDLDFAHRRQMSGVGESGDGKGRGMDLQPILAVEPDSPEVLGWA